MPSVQIARHRRSEDQVYVVDFHMIKLGVLSPSKPLRQRNAWLEEKCGVKVEKPIQLFQERRLISWIQPMSLLPFFPYRAFGKVTPKTCRRKPDLDPEMSPKGVRSLISWESAVGC
jgi:hypothetical protein